MLVTYVEPQKLGTKYVVTNISVTSQPPFVKILFQLASAKSYSKTDWKYEQINVKVDPTYKNGQAPFYKEMYFILWSKRGGSYQSDVAIDDFLVREGECQVSSFQ